jgi:putative transposase
MVWGCLLSLRQPDADALGATMIMGALKKDNLVERFKLRSEWPTYGVPYQVHTDNGMDFRSDAFEVGCQMNNIDLMRRPPRRPRYGGPIERFMGTLNTRFVETLHGKTFNNTVVRKLGNYNPERQACLTIDDLEHLFLEYVVEQYHNTIHSELHMSPRDAWYAALKDGIFEPKEPDAPENFRMDFLSFVDPDGRRGIESDGVHFKDISYYAPGLESLQPLEIDGHTPRRYVVRYDRADVRYLYLLDDRDGKHQYIPLVMKNAPDKPFTLNDLEIARRAYRTEGNHRPSPEIVVESIRTRIEKLKELASIDKKALRAVAASERTQELHDLYGNKPRVEEQSRSCFDDGGYRPTMDQRKIRLSFEDESQRASDD